jgi:hypothetical protein
MRNKSGAVVTVKTFLSLYGYLHPIYGGVKKEETTNLLVGYVFG